MPQNTTTSPKPATLQDLKKITGIRGKIKKKLTVKKGCGCGK